MSAASGSRARRLIGAAMFALWTIRFWHLLLFRQSQEQPVIVAAWLVLGLGLAAFAFRFTRIQLAFAAYVAVLLFLFHWGFERAASDGREYFVQVRSLVMDRDLDFANETAVLGARGTAKMYPFGSAVLWSPFMALAHGWLAILNHFGGNHTLDGFTNPYQRAIGLGTLVYGVLGLILLFRIVRDFFSEGAALASVVVVSAGTFMLWYLVVENSMSHGVSMFATALFLYVWHCGRREMQASGATAHTTRWWVVLGLTAGLMAMARWQNGLIAAAPVAISLWQTYRRGQKVVAPSLLVGASFIVSFLPQLIFWKVVRGGWFAIPSTDHVWSPSSLHLADVLFSPNHGLLSTTPIVWLAVIGLPLLFRRDAAMAFVLVVAVASQVFANAGSDGWWGGPSYGARRFDGCLLAFALGLPAAVAWFRQRPLVAPVAIICGLLALNLALMQDVRSRRLPSSDAIMFTDMMDTVEDRVGNPFSFPYSFWIAWKYSASPAVYDRLRGRSFNNVAIDFGDDGDEMFLGHGWRAPERNEARSFRWASGDTASLVIPLKAADNYRLEFTCEPFSPPGRPPQTVNVVINGSSITKLTLAGLQTYTIDLPAAALRPNLNGIRFEFAYAVSPSDAGVSSDPRTLSVMFDTLRLTRIMKQ